MGLVNIKVRPGAPADGCLWAGFLNHPSLFDHCRLVHVPSSRLSGDQEAGNFCLQFRVPAGKCVLVVNVDLSCRRGGDGSANAVAAE